MEAKAHEAEEKRSSEEQKTALAVEKTARAEDRYQEIRAKYKEVAPAVNVQVIHEMETLGYHSAAFDMKNRLSKYNALKDSLSYEQREFLDTMMDDIFDGSVIVSMAENAASICSIAASLYLGYLDNATRIAQSCGGGGGPGTGWGKRDDEDDLAFRQRCFFMALHMMRPSQKVQRKR